MSTESSATGGGKISITSIGMQFCEVCDTLLKPKTINDQLVAYCSECNIILGQTSPEKIDTQEELDHHLITIQNDNLGNTTSLPKTEEFCRSCDQKVMVYYEHKRSATADEGLVKQYTCTVCGHSWEVNF